MLRMPNSILREKRNFGGYQSWLNRAGRYRSPGDKLTLKRSSVNYLNMILKVGL
jgi:hypothetical protein